MRRLSLIRMIKKLSQGHPTRKWPSRVWKLHSLTAMSVLPPRGGEEIRRMPVEVAQRS